RFPGVIEHVAQRTVSSPPLILRLRFSLDLTAESSAQKSRRVQVDLASEEIRKLFLHCEEAQARDMPGFELDEHIDVAVRAKIVSKHRAEEGQSPDVVFPAEVSDLGLIY